MSSQFQTLSVTGRDRVRFLHNFCTADIRGLTPNQAAEAFFTDARARIVAHGYVLMLEDQLQIWLLADNPLRLHKHLDRYIISEDVKLSPADDGDFLALHAAGLEQPPEPPAMTPGRCSIVSTPGGPVTELCVSWAGQTLRFFCGNPSAIAQLRQSPDLQPLLLNDHALQQLRIAERFPIIGVDLSSDHLAPEADRNNRAISYTKGCYLGQEPIARIDALGHINRALRLVRLAELPHTANTAAPEQLAAEVVGAELLMNDGTAAGTLTSAAPAPAENVVLGLSVLRLASAAQISQARLANGRLLAAEIP